MDINARNLNKAGVIYSLRGEHDIAIRFYLTALSLDPTYSYAHYNLATAYYKKGMYLHAIEEFSYYLQLSPFALDREHVIEKIEKLRNKILSEELEKVILNDERR
jgi:tetratricopeptide (TPR) repeat protein